MKNQLVDLRAAIKDSFPTWKRPIGVRTLSPQGDEDAANGDTHEEEGDKREAAAHVLTWTKLEKRVSTAIGTEKAEAAIRGEFAIPPTEALDRRIAICTSEAQKTAESSLKKPQEKHTRSNHWDWQNN